MSAYELKSRELKLVHQELETQGDLLNQEQLERKTQVDRLRLEIETIKKVLAEILPEFDRQYKKLYEETLREFDPEHLSSNPLPKTDAI